ncbi:MAG: 4-hydroxy-3-methylbut-2-enyl diphosphate reductase [Atribacterota bacterium]|nr:4-hydroxy-3-methylbut-2-enyl diphosphate reductase [Atribacterota bacterium]
MKIVKARYTGFCFGVKRAVDKANEALKKYSDEDIYMLGEIIHNPQIIMKYREEGMKIVENIYQVPSDKKLITRAHGMSKQEKEDAQKRDIKLIDTTCPYVKKIHLLANALVKEKYKLAVYGNPNHPEIKSLLSYFADDVLVFQTKKEINPDIFSKNKRIGLISQTTQELKKYTDIAKKILMHVDELKVFNTICKATSLRQNSTLELAKDVDLLIVVGGKNSANTKRLFCLSKESGIKVYHIESEEELNKKWFIGKERIGISSGASTPDCITEKVINKIKDISKK